MDTIKKQLLDDKRAQEIFPRVRARLSSQRLKTNESYLSILMDEINKYFAELSTSSINSNDLPNSHNGPISEKHNKLIMNIANDIDKIHGKRIEVQDIITKATNYLSTERVSLSNAVSKMQSRVINQKLRSSINDRHLTVFTEYFTDDTYVDKKQSKNIEVNPSISALTLIPLTKNEDNSNIIDSASIRLSVEADFTGESNRVASVYPLCNQPLGDSSLFDNDFFCGFGRTITDSSVDSPLMNLNSADYSNQERFINIQNQCLAVGVAGGEDKNTHGEFELIFNDFNSVTDDIDNDIKTAVKKSVLNETGYDLDERHIIFDKESTTGINSFNGARETSNTNPQDLKKLIKKIGLKFKLKNSGLRGSLSYIRINFSPAKDVLYIPKINYTGCWILDGGERKNPFAEMALNENINSISESKFLLLDTPVTNPTEVYIDFDLDSLQLVPIKTYRGVCWKVKLHGSTNAGEVSIPGITQTEVLNSSTTREIYVYHDIVRTSDGSKAKDLNIPILKGIISTYEKSTN
jgi:hypothetical protein